jgi:WD40 repeat protein
MTRVQLLRRWLAPAAVAVAALGVTACGSKPPAKSTSPAAANQAAVGPALYPAAPEAKMTPQTNGPEPIVVPQGLVQFDETVTLSAEVDGKLELVATPLEEAAKLNLDAAKYPDRLIGHPRKLDWKHVRVQSGDAIKAGQVLASLDDSQAILDKLALEASVDASDKALVQSNESLGEYEKVVKAVDGLGSSASLLEKVRYKIEYVQAKVSAARLFQEYTKLKGDLDKAADRKLRHQIVSPFDGKVVRVLRDRGVVVKAGEPILEVQNTSRFRIEAKVSQETAAALERKLPLAVNVEPVQVLPPERYTARQRLEITGLAVFVADGRPVVVSGSADGTARVWDATSPKQASHFLPHPSGVAVRSVAAVARGDARWVATGGSDGRVRLWDVSDLANLPTKPMHEFEEAHAQGVGALTFSPDAQYLASAAGRDVFVWDAVGKKKKYTVPADHRDDVKAVHFTPQATLVTVCRDKAIRVWTLGGEGAALLRTFDHRSGAVDVLGVSGDGGRVLFDQNAGRMDLVSLADGGTTGSLLNTGSGQRFSGLALFSPDGRQVLTGAGDADAKGELQVWSVLDAGRGAERKRLATPGRTAVTCAAFSPDAAHRFVAVGTQGGDVHFWVLPAETTQPAAVPGKLVSVTRVDASTSMLRVEVDNTGGKYDEQLYDRGAARLVIDPTAKAMPPGPMPVIPAAPGQPKAAVPPVVDPLAGK